MAPPQQSVSAPERDREAAPEGEARRLLRYARPVAHLILLGSALGVTTRGFSLAVPFFTARIIDSAAGQLDPSTLNSTGLLLVLIVLGAALTQFAAAMVFAYVGERIVLEVRGDIFSHVLSLSDVGKDQLD